MACAWTWTWNNPGDKVPDYKERTMHYIVWAPQRAPTTGTPHLQGYVQFKKPKARGEAVKMLGGKVAAFKSKGTYAQNRAYIVDDEKKTNTGPAVEHGVPQVDMMNTPSMQGMRTDLIEARTRFEAGETAKTVEKEMPDLFAKYPGYMQKLVMDGVERKEVAWPINIWGINITKPDPANKKRHYWFHGPADIGKTRVVGEATKGMRVYWAPPDAKYRFENYDDESIVIYDDHYPKLEELINVSNHAYGRQQRPGGRRYIAGYWKEGSDRTIIVLSNKEPELWPASFHARFNVVELDAEGVVTKKSPYEAWRDAGHFYGDVEWRI